MIGAVGYVDRYVGSVSAMYSSTMIWALTPPAPTLVIPASLGTLSPSTVSCFHGDTSRCNWKGHALTGVVGSKSSGMSVGTSVLCFNERMTLVNCAIPDAASLCPMVGLTEPIL